MNLFKEIFIMNNWIWRVKLDNNFKKDLYKILGFFIIVNSKYLGFCFL